MKTSNRTFSNTTVTASPYHSFLNKLAYKATFPAYMLATVALLSTAQAQTQSAVQNQLAYTDQPALHEIAAKISAKNIEKDIQS